ncbi:hypothetical protein GALL_532330 [mine drainage metagenome]|uniref:HEPN domain-containing protein n=1 Tax=mine drainage metagenome TaxID=410659 RepID=A0A1J5PIV6_9ZZZZ
MFGDELRGQLFLSLSSQHARFFDDTAAFGEAVKEAFPSAEFDIAEAAKCRAVGRWTACVVHCMRALEVPLQALAKNVGVEPGENWNTLINRIEEEARKVTKTTHGPEGEQWISEALAYLRLVKNAWRNYAVHGRATYDEDRAVAIFDGTKTFMQQVATKLSEYDDGL